MVLEVYDKLNDSAFSQSSPLIYKMHPLLELIPLDFIEELHRRLVLLAVAASTEINNHQFDKT